MDLYLHFWRDSVRSQRAKYFKENPTKLLRWEELRFHNVNILKRVMETPELLK